MTKNLTRRSFAASAAMLPFAIRCFAHTPSSPRWVFLGTDKGAGIYRCSWDPSTGHLGPAELAVKSERPGFLALHPKLPRLYAANEMTGAKAVISSFHLDSTTGSLEFADSQSSLGDGPCYLSLDKTGRSAFAANYPSGSFTAYALAADGSLKPPIGSFDCRNNPACGASGPVHPNQESPHMHSATVAPGNDFVLACNLGNDSIEVFPIHPGADNPLATPQRVATRPGSGPRHVAFHPNRRWLYVTHELDVTVELYDWSVRGKKASLTRREGTMISTLPAGAKPPANSACEVLVSKNGRFVYTCTRGPESNTIEVFAVDAESGKLTFSQRLSCGGKVPRHIAFDPTERWLLCSNQGGPGVTVFAHEPQTGKLSGPVQTLPADSPMFVQFV